MAYAPPSAIRLTSSVPGGLASARPEDGGGLTPRLWLCALLVAVAACAVRVVFAEQRGFWLDEYFTLNAARMSVPDMVANRLGAGHSPLYFFYARLGLLIGSSERALRFTSALAAGGLVLTLTGLMGELKLARHLPALWTLAIIEPYWMSIGTEYRYTMPLVAIAAGVAWVAARYAARPGHSRGWSLALALTVLLWTHGSAPFFAIGLLAFLLWDGWATLREQGRRRLAALSLALLRAWPILAGAVAAVPFYYMVRNHPSEFEDQQARLKDVLKDLIDVVFGEHRLWFNCFDWRHHSWLFNLEIAVFIGALVLAWRELKRCGALRARRLLAAIMVAIPCIMFAFCVSVRNFSGPVRYMATFTIPAVICLAVAAGARPRPRALRWLYLAGLTAALAFQSSALTLERGDRHRDAIRWVLANQEGDDPILMANILNRSALKFYGLPSNKNVTLSGYNGTLAETVARMRTQLATVRRGVFIRYHSSAQIREGLQELQKQGFLAGVRTWRVAAGGLYVGAFARDPKELPWLNSRQEPHKEWGPAIGDR